MTSFRFMSWNWNCFSDGRNHRKIDLIQRMGPHVLALQEVDERAHDDLREAFGDRTLLMPDVWDDPKASIDPKGHRLPSTALLIAAELNPEAADTPDFDVWKHASPRCGLGFDPSNLADGTIPEPRSIVGAFIRVGGTRTMVVSAHPPHAAGEGDERVARILRKRRTYEVLRQYVTRDLPLMIGMDANAWIDPEPAERTFGQPLPKLADRVRDEPSLDQTDIGIFLDNGFVQGELDEAGPRDALHIWLEADKVRRDEVLARRPYGPWAVTYNRSANYARPDRRDLVMVSTDVKVLNVEHNYEDSLAAGSDHSYVLCDLKID